jgi:hypothetical protein
MHHFVLFIILSNSLLIIKLFYFIFKLVAAVKQATNLIESLIPSIAERLPLDMPFDINSAYSKIRIIKVKAGNLDTALYQGLGKFELPKFCGEILKSGYTNTSSSTKSDQFYTPQDYSCESQPIVVKVK